MKYSDEEIKKVINLYKKGYNCYEIANLLGNRSHQSINSLLNKNGISTKKGFIAHLTNKENDDICMRYINGESTCKIGKLYNVTDHVISKVLRMNNIKIRPTGVIPASGNQSYFNLINDEKKAYIIGLLMADGYIIIPNRKSPRSPIWGITLNKNDSYLLDEIRQVIGIEKKIYYQRNEAILTVSSKEMVQDLSKYNIVKNKHFSISFPFDNIDEIWWRHVIRGIFDGDGCIYKNHCTFYGNRYLITDVKNILIQSINISNNSIFYKKDGVCMFSFSKKTDIISFYNYIYQDASIYLKRKYSKFQDLGLIFD